MSQFKSGLNASSNTPLKKLLEELDKTITQANSSAKADKIERAEAFKTWTTFEKACSDDQKASKIDDFDEIVKEAVALHASDAKKSSVPTIQTLADPTVEYSLLAHFESREISVVSPNVLV